MSNKVIKVKQFLSKIFPEHIQIFNSRNIMGDYMESIYNDDDIIVDWCERYDYIEVFGVSAEEYQMLCDTVGNGHMNGQYEGN